jgi:hypothetical protein
MNKNTTGLVVVSDYYGKGDKYYWRRNLRHPDGSERRRSLCLGSCNDVTNFEAQRMAADLNDKFADFIIDPARNREPLAVRADRLHAFLANSPLNLKNRRM